MQAILRQSVGIDISKDSFTAAIAVLDNSHQVIIRSTKQFNNQTAGFEKLIKWVNQFQEKTHPITYVMEATGVYYESLAYWLADQQAHISVVLASQVKFFAKSLNIKSKTDAIDAKIIAQFGLERKLPLWQVASNQLRTLKQLCRERQALKDEKTMVSNQLHALKHSYQPSEKSLKRMQNRLQMLQAQIKEIETDIAAALEKQPSLKERVEKVASIKGVGMITAVTIIAETNGFALFKNKAQLVCYAGYDVVENQSGTSVHSPTRISKKGNTVIRKALHFPAVSAARFEPALKALYERIYEKTRIKMKGIVAVQRKLLVLIYTLFKSNTVYQPSYSTDQ